MKHINRIIFALYQIARSARYSLLMVVFGYVSHCKHSPTCGTFAWRTWQTQGLIGLPKIIKRLASCW